MTKLVLKRLLLLPIFIGKIIDYKRDLYTLFPSFVAAVANFYI